METNLTRVRAIPPLDRQDPMARRQRDLEHSLLRALVEGEIDLAAAAPAIVELRALCELRATTPRSTTRGAESVLIDFAVKAITEAMASLIANFEFLMHPAEGYVSWYNDTDAYVHVMTFDQDDAVRWVPYEERVVAPKQVVQLTARGNRIHIKTPANGATYDCDKAQSYLFSGTNCYPRVA
ncbi:MAG: hypothetical protein ABMA64_31390 [Myxococcota bacterium]